MLRGLLGIQPILKWFPGKADMVEGSGRGELLTSWWTRKQREQGGAGRASATLPGHAPVSHFLPVQSAAGLLGDEPWISTGPPVTSQDPSPEHMRVWGNVLDLNCNGGALLFFFLPRDAHIWAVALSWVLELKVTLFCLCRGVLSTLEWCFRWWVTLLGQLGLPCLPQWADRCSLEDAGAPRRIYLMENEGHAEGGGRKPHPCTT